MPVTVPGHRILVYGVTGSGKSTLARQIAQRCGLPGYVVDDLTWQPGWVQLPPDVQRARFAAICAEDEWVLDSAYSSWRDVVLDRADLIVGLDYPRWLSLTRLIRRSVLRILDRRLVCNGNVETVRGLFSADSIVRWHFRSFAGKRARLREWAAGGIDVPVVLLSSPRQTRAWLARVGR